MKFTKKQESLIIGTFCEGDIAAVGRPKYQYLAGDFARVLERFNKNGIGISPRLISSASEAYTTNISWGYCFVVAKTKHPSRCAHGPVSKRRLQCFGTRPNLEGFWRNLEKDGKMPRSCGNAVPTHSLIKVHNGSKQFRAPI